MPVVTVSITNFVSDDEPGWVRCILRDAAGRDWEFLEKGPIVSRDLLTARSSFPQDGELACRIAEKHEIIEGRAIVRIDTSHPWGVESVDGNNVFEVFADQVREVSAILYGECSPWPTKEFLASALQSAGLRVYVGQYSVQLRGNDDFSFSFESYGGDLGEPAITADAEYVELLIRGGKAVSAALTAAGIRHRFEIYDEKQEPVAYLHYKWPAEGS